MRKEILEYLTDAEARLVPAARRLRDYSTQSSWSGGVRINESTTYYATSSWEIAAEVPRQLFTHTTHALAIGIVQVGRVKLEYAGDGKIYVTDVSVNADVPFVIGEALSAD